MKFTKKTYISIFLFLFFTSTELVANSLEASLNTCKSLFKDQEQLSECINNAKKIDESKLRREKNNNKWEVKNSVNPLDDSSTVMLRLKASTGKNVYNSPAWLYIRCKKNHTDLYIDWGDYLGPKASVTSRIGHQKSVTNIWNMSSNSQSTFSPKPIKIIKKIMESNKFVAQVVPYNKDPITAIFYTTGLKLTINPLRKECHW